jgi:malonyl-CoA/methylmalonyl-CoA synthetase
VSGNHLYDRLFRRGNPAAVALRAAGGSLTYAELDRRAGQMAGALIAMGVQPGDRVAAQVEKSVANLLLYLGVVRAGGVFLPLNTGYTDNEVGYFVGDAEPRLFICDPEREAAFQTRFPGLGLLTLDAEGEGSLTDAARAITEPPAVVAREPEDLAAICYTSGTTGRSKGAMLSHRALVANAETLVDLWGFTPDDTLIHALPIYHVHGLFVATNVTLMAGARMLFQPRFEPGAVLEACGEATVLMGVPTFYTRLLNDPRLTRERVASMRLFVSGSAPLLAQTHKDWEARTGHRILERYGMTETGMNTSNPLSGERRAGSVGPALPDVAVRVVDPDTGKALPVGEVGMIEVKGPNLFSGYWRMPEKTAAEFRPDGFFITGDLGVVDQEGYVSIIGRGKDLIISGGLNIYPKEVEMEIDALPGVVESAVIGLPHSDFGEAVTAVVAVGKGPPPAEADILGALSERLARFKQPKRVLFVADLPRNAMGKVQKARLRELHADLYQQG